MNFPLKGLNILYQDDDLVAINKPAGLLVHRSDIDRHETEFAVQRLRNELGKKVYPIHRLDKPTSGILLFGLNSEVTRVVSQQFQEGKVEKRYHALTRGWLKEDAFYVDYALSPIRDKIADRQKKQDAPKQTAQTQFYKRKTFYLEIPVGRYPGTRFQLLEVLPKTGRKHQIRRHCKHIFHPIIGDTRYGEGRFNRFFRTQVEARELMLCATELSFQHPATQSTLTITCPLSPAMAKAIDFLEAHHKSNRP